MKNLGTTFYVLLGVLTFLTLGSVALWLFTNHVAFFILLLVFFAVFVAFLVLTLTGAGKMDSAYKSERADFRNLLLDEHAKCVVVEPYCKAKRIIAPNARKHDFYVAIYDGKAEELIKMTDEQREESIAFMGSFAFPYGDLAFIKNKNLLVRNDFFELIKNNEYYAELVKNNAVVFLG